MKFIQDYKEGDRVSDIYLCKHKQLATTKNGKPYETAVLQDKQARSTQRSGIRTAWGSVIMMHWIISRFTVR